MTIHHPFGTRAGDSLRWDGKGHTMTEAQYLEAKNKRKGTPLKDFSTEEAHKHQDNLRKSGFTSEE